MTRDTPTFRRLATLASRTTVPFTCDNRPLDGRAGDTVAAALLVHGITPFRRAPDDAPRAPYCLMGVCQDCRVTIDGIADQRACRIALKPGMAINTNHSGREAD